MRPPRARAALSASAVSAETCPISACILWSVGVVGLDRQESAGPDMQRHEVPLDAARVERGEQLRREMQAGGRRGDRAFLPRVDRLVVGAVARVVGPLRGDVGRQRHVADRVRAPRRGTAPERSKPSSTSPPSRFSSTVASSAAEQAGIRRHGRSGCGRRPRGAWPAARRPASGRARCACAASPRHCAAASPRRRMPLSCAGMTLVSLKTSASPGRSRSGRSRTTRSPSALARLARQAAAPHRAARRAAARCGLPADRNRRAIDVHCTLGVRSVAAATAGPVVRDHDPGRAAGDSGDPGVPPLRRVGDLHRDDLVGILHRLAALDLVDIVHAFDDLAPDRVLAVEEAGVARSR